MIFTRQGKRITKILSRIPCLREVQSKYNIYADIYWKKFKEKITKKIKITKMVVLKDKMQCKKVKIVQRMIRVSS
jgi:hypothetical protein